MDSLDISQLNYIKIYFIQLILKLTLQECIAGFLYFFLLRHLSLAEKVNMLIFNCGEIIIHHLCGMNGH